MELRAADLRFTSSEAADFLNRVMGLNLSPEDIAELETRTEGWIAGLQLAALALQGRRDVAAFVQSFTGSSRYILDYLVDEVFETTRSIPKAMRIVAIAKSAQRNNLANDLPRISVPTFLVWGLNDTITPPMVAHEFNRLIPTSQLKFIDQCCHAPMMEHPEKFNDLVEEFLVGQQ